ncbi:MAG: AAA family ATPase [Coleofasciculus sp. G1-WW12-02]|uniref:AAA family ATPase n=1 Tax=Coleofasciculus sp. G1-WW12-02 TaxID=3068483 RepID=UPI003303A931
MKIKKLEYYDNEYQWKLEPVDFLQNLNLLVGVSGVGKTRILRSISNLKKIANGASLNGVRWNVCFLTSDDLEYHWSGEFETKKSTTPIDSDSSEEEQVKIICETLKRNQETIVERTQEKIIFHGEKTPKLSPYESIIELLKQEDSIIRVKEELDKIILADSGRSFDKTMLLPVSIFKKYEKSSLLSLKESNLPILIKLAILYRILPEEFEKIKKTFTIIFPNVADIKIESLKDEDIPIALSQLLKEATTVSIKEKGVQNWIKNISSGMFKTLMYISQLYLSPDNCVILIDEFENSLGVNCLDSVTDLILDNQGSQFMVTSHHPYVINNISPAYWKIVTRQGSLVTVKNAEDFHISESRQKAFIDLINVLEDDEY